MIVLLAAAKISTVFLGVQIDFRLTYIALVSALPVLLFSPKRYGIIKGIDWRTLIFFAAMFVLMHSVWNTGFLQDIIGEADFNITSILMILIVSVILSQFISNVPLPPYTCPCFSAPEPRQRRWRRWQPEAQSQATSSF